MNINMLIIISIVVVTVCAIYIMRQNKIEPFAIFDYTERTGPKDYQFSKYKSYDDTVYEESVKNTYEKYPNMICNLLPTISEDECNNSDTNKSFQRKRFPVHIIKVVGGEYLAVFNNGRIYSKNKLNDRFWKGPLKNSLIDEQTPLRMITIDSTGLLLGVGYDNKLYRKKQTDVDDEKYETRWEYIPNNDNLIYVMYQTADRLKTVGSEKDELIAIDTRGFLMKKRYDAVASDEYVQSQNDNFPVVKIFMDKNGVMLGIGKDMKLYKKERQDWESSSFDMITGGNRSQLNDVLYDNDAKLFGLVFVPSMGVLELMKQKMMFYLSEFIPLEFASSSEGRVNVLNDLEIIKFKTGVNYPIIFGTDDDYGDHNIIEAKERLEMEDKKKLRVFCARKGYTGVTQYHNFELLTRMEEQHKKIEELNKVINKIVEFDPDKHKLQEIEIK